MINTLINVKDKLKISYFLQGNLWFPPRLLLVLKRGIQSFTHFYRGIAVLKYKST